MDPPNVAAFLLTLDGSIAGWGAGAESLFGYGAEEVVGREVTILVPPDEASGFPRILAAVARGEHVNISRTMATKDGTRLDVALVLGPAGNDGVRVTGARAVVRNITGERTEEERGWLAAVLESSHDGLYTLDRHGVIRTWNPGAERLYGYAAHEAVGLPGASMVPEGLRQEATMALECVLAGEPVELFETEGRRRDGHLVPVSLSLWPIHDRRGAVVGASVIARTLTEERLMQVALAESEARLRVSESLAHVGGWVWDVATGGVQWSEELHHIHGVDPADFGGTLEAHLEPVHPDDRRRVRAAMEAAVAESEPLQIRYRIVRPGGEVRWLHGRTDVVLASPDTATPAGLRGVCQDVTETKEVEDARQACYEVLSRVSREVRGPLQATLGLAERLERTEFGKEQAEGIAAILKATHDLVEFVDHALHGGGSGTEEPPTAARTTDPSA